MIIQSHYQCTTLASLVLFFVMSAKGRPVCLDWRGLRLALVPQKRLMERSTIQRSAIHDALKRAGRPLLALEVLELACEAVPRIGIATIYRNLKTMVDEGLLRQVVLPGENPRFELSGHGHHHHFQCKQCQKVYDIHSCPTDLAALAPKGFTIDDHDLTLYGRCKNC